MIRGYKTLYLEVWRMGLWNRLHVNVGVELLRVDVLTYMYRSKQPLSLYGMSHPRIKQITIFLKGEWLLLMNNSKNHYSLRGGVPTHEY